MVKNRPKWLDLTIIFILSLIPFIWTWGGYSIIGHDAGTPLSPDAHFLDRLYTWTARYGLGSDQTFALPGFFIHGLEYVLTLLKLPVSLEQAVSFSLYSLGMGLGMYYLATTLFPDRKYLPIAASIFYEINHFVLQAWFIAERTKFTLYISLPIIIAYIYKIYRNEKNPYFYGFMTAVVLFVLNGAGFIPLYGAFFIAIPMLLVFFILISKEKIALLIRYIIFSVVTLVVSLALNAYWLLPYIQYVRSSFSTEVAKSGGIGGVINWVMSISENASYMNLLRLQGIQEWYVNQYHTYAPYFLHNIILIALSFLLPIAVVASFLIKNTTKEDKNKLIIFGIIALVSMFFMAGSHSPFGSLYLLFIRYIPGFIAFRTPYYKFAPALWLSYSLFVGFAYNFLAEKYGTKISPPIKKLFIVILIVLYSFPILGTKFFTYYKDRATRLKIPQYVTDYGKWANSNDFHFRRMLILPPEHPEQKASQTDWGYWSLASINSLLDKRSYVEHTLSNTPEAEDLITSLYNYLNDGNPQWLSVAQQLNVDGILLRDDAVPYDYNGQHIDSQFYANLLKKFPFIQEEKSFGKWHVLRISNENPPLRVINGYYKVDGSLSAPLPISLHENTILTSQDSPEMSQLKIADIILPNCENCDLTNSGLLEENRDVRVIPGSKLYNLKLKAEQNNRKKITGLKELVLFDLQNTVKRLFEVEKLYSNNSNYDSKIAGWHSYTMHLQLLQNSIENYYKQNNLTIDSDSSLLTVKNNLLLEIAEIREVLGSINTQDEGAAADELLSQLQNTYNFTNNLIFVSNSVFEKKYLVNLPSSGNYDLYLYIPSINLDANPDETLLYNIDDKSYKTKIQKTQPWVKLSGLTLPEGLHKIILNENQGTNLFPTSNLGQDGTMILKSDNNTKNCSSIDLGKLNSGKYLFNAKIKAKNGTSVVYMFMNSRGAPNPILPYWGDKYSVAENGYLTISKDFMADSSSYTFSVCQFFTDQPTDIILSNPSLEKVTIPELALLKNNPDYTLTSLRTLHVNQKNNVEYMGSIDAGGPQILLFDQSFSPQWQLKTSNVPSQSFTADTYTNGWYIPASNKSEPISLYYLPQLAYEKGKKITYVSVILVCLGLLISNFYRKKHVS